MEEHDTLPGTAVAEMRPLLEMLRLNTRLYLNCFEGVSEAQAQVRPNEHTNSMLFIGLHLLDARCYMAMYAGLEIGHAYEQVLADVRSIEEVGAMPSAREVCAEWERVSAAMISGLSDVPEAVLRGESPLRFPVEDGTVLGGIAFLIQHDSYHIGQLALIRKFLGCGPMRYR